MDSESENLGENDALNCKHSQSSEGWLFVCLFVKFISPEIGQDVKKIPGGTDHGAELSSNNFLFHSV